MQLTKNFKSLLELFLLREYPRRSFISVSPLFYQKVMATTPIVQEPVFAEILQPVFVPEESVLPTQSSPIHPAIPKEKPIVSQESVVQQQNVLCAPSLITNQEVVLEDVVEKGKWKRFFATYYPRMQIREEIPSDALAKQQKELYQTSVFLLLGEEEDASFAFFQKIADAITARFGPALCLRADVWKQKVQDRNWRERGTLFLLSKEAEVWLLKEGIALKLSLLLESAATYQQEPEKKAPLWQAICSELCRSRK